MPITMTPPKIYHGADESGRPEIPRPPDIEDYLSRVRAVSERLVKFPGTPSPPPDMEHLDFVEANNIELSLIGTERAIHAMEDSFISSGEIEAGGY